MWFEFFLFIFGALFSWISSHCYYKKSLKSQGDEFESIRKKLSESLFKKDPKNELLLHEQRMQSALEEYRRQGTPKKVIDSFNDLSEPQKTEFFDNVLLRAKGRKAKKNPYMN